VTKDLSFDSRQGPETFIYPVSRPSLVSTQLPVEQEQQILSEGVKWLQFETDHKPPSSVEVRNEWRNISTAPSACLVCTGTVYSAFISGICNSSM
jgi:hypothetical protein